MCIYPVGLGAKRVLNIVTSKVGLLKNNTTKGGQATGKRKQETGNGERGAGSGQKNYSQGKCLCIDSDGLQIVQGDGLHFQPSIRGFSFLGSLWIR